MSLMFPLKYSSTAVLPVEIAILSKLVLLDSNTLVLIKGSFKKDSRIINIYMI